MSLDGLFLADLPYATDVVLSGQDPAPTGPSFPLNFACDKAEGPAEEFPSFGEEPLRGLRSAGWLAFAGVAGSLSTHAATFAAIYWLTLLGAISLIPARVEGRKTVISMEAVFVPAPTPETKPEVTTDVFEAPSFEPLKVAHENVPLKVEVTPDHVQIQQQMYVLKSHEIVRPELEHSPYAASSPSPSPSASQAMPPPDRRDPSRTEHRKEHVAKRPTPDVLAAFTPPSVPIPADAGVEETPARLSPNNPPPIYPAEAIARGWIGNVELRVTISPSGLVGKIEVASSSGHPVLDAAAYHAVRLWRFHPMHRGGVPVESVLRVPVHFLPRQ
jgi:protein TonB